MADNILPYIDTEDTYNPYNSPAASGISTSSISRPHRDQFERIPSRRRSAPSPILQLHHPKDPQESTIQIPSAHPPATPTSSVFSIDTVPSLCSSASSTPSISSREYPLVGSMIIPDTVSSLLSHPSPTNCPITMSYRDQYAVKPAPGSHSSHHAMDYPLTVSSMDNSSNLFSTANHAGYGSYGQIPNTTGTSPALPRRTSMEADRMNDYAFGQPYGYTQSIMNQHIPAYAPSYSSHAHMQPGLANYGGSASDPRTHPTLPLTYNQTHSGYLPVTTAGGNYIPTFDGQISPMAAHGERLIGTQHTKEVKCFDHGCNGRPFSTHSNYLRHVREKSGTATKSVCPKCGASFTRKTAMTGHMQQNKCRRGKPTLSTTPRASASRSATPPSRRR